jgi:short-subunit dehydrogenase
MTDFVDRYGPWALVAGASEGIGAAFATALAGHGISLVLVARRPEPLAELASRLTVRTVQVATDLSTVEGLASVYASTVDKEIGLVVCNAAYAPVGAFLDLRESQLDAIVDLNCRAPAQLARHYLPSMVERGRGGLVVMSSLSGNQGSPGLAAYAASKAFGAVLAEGLWAESRGTGVDVVTCVAGAVSTPGLGRVATRPAPGTVTPEAVAARALSALGHGPRAVPGALMRFSAPLMSRLLPKKTAIGVMGRAAKGLGPES